ncbi:hypothetical protein ACFVY1_40120 [Streptomyces sp. NPDC058293]|uniref:hypothetical protein n=1 Tax=Streptomyces sp. NPDC058293 TaxID=3346429 RepID=UPI0036ED84A0
MSEAATSGTSRTYDVVVIGAGPVGENVADPRRRPACPGASRHQEAEALAREALAALCAPDRLSLVLRLGLARSLNGQARHQQALAEAERADKLRRSLPEERHRPETGAVELAVATALLGLRRGAGARLKVAAAHDACLASFGPDHRRTVAARALLDRSDGA